MMRTKVSDLLPGDVQINELTGTEMRIIHSVRQRDGGRVEVTWSWVPGDGPPGITKSTWSGHISMLVRQFVIDELPL